MLKLRTDAAQNRADILAAADLVFAECGVTAPLDLVCKQAGVGRATLYRNFPDRHGLLLALLDRSINEMEDKARSLGEAPNAFFKLLRFQAERISARSSLVDYWRVIDREAPEIRRARQRMHALIKPHLERAVSAKLCRADLNDEDISLLTSMHGAALRGRTPDEQATRLPGAAAELDSGGAADAARLASGDLSPPIRSRRLCRSGRSGRHHGRPR